MKTTLKKSKTTALELSYYKRRIMELSTLSSTNIIEDKYFRKNMIRK